MEIEVKRVTDWRRVVDAARLTVGKPPLGKEPSDEFKSAIIRAEHSPLRLLEFDVTLRGIPKYVSVHLCRHHEGVEKFVSTSRPDRTDSNRTRHDGRDDDLVDMQLSLNAQAFLNISRVRLCEKAEAETRRIWRCVIRKLMRIEPLLGVACVPNCIYRGMCPEMKPCRGLLEHNDKIETMGETYKTPYYKPKL